MRIVIAPNAFKGSLTAGETAQSIATGLKQSPLSCTLKLMPVADGGDGTAHLISKRMSAKSVKILVHDPLGKKIFASYGWVNKTKTAIIELADASGLRLIKQDDLNPMKSNSRGTGELIKSALDKGAQKIILGIGGSATIDGASGLLDELGVKFLDKSERKITELPKGLLALNRINISGIGGVAAGLAAFANAKLVSGISYFLDLIKFENELKKTDLIITAEGRLDTQTLEGKGPYGVAEKAMQHKIPVIILAGEVPPKAGKELHRYFKAILPIGHGPSSTEDAVKNTAADLERTAFELGNLLALK